ncbi:FxsA family protein [Parashewanella curva]|uniref:FxsA family protein n=1 Tax=Parashewanella curva TaxID=2338552 RepID=A0A3L8PW27_9GAMM|nr:FxsA family protein [Parashewanella curva]RLV59536.1 FxsA family protein [Parashewanella curva]
MIFALLGIFILLPILEIALMIHVGTVLGTWNTVALIILTTIIGGSLVRSQGIENLKKVRSKVDHGEMPGSEIIQSMMLAIAGVMLFLPGFITDFVGVLFLTPFTRKPIANFLLAKMKVQIVNRQAGFHYQQGFGKDGYKNDGDVFEGDFERKSEEVKPENRLDDKDEPHK